MSTQLKFLKINQRGVRLVSKNYFFSMCTSILGHIVLDMLIRPFAFPEVLVSRTTTLKAWHSSFKQQQPSPQLFDPLHLSTDQKTPHGVMWVFLFSGQHWSSLEPSSHGSVGSLARLSQLQQGVFWQWWYIFLKINFLMATVINNWFFNLDIIGFLIWKLLRKMNWILLTS